MSSLGLNLREEETSVRDGAGFGVRALARAIDALVHLAIGAAAGLAMGILIGIASALHGTPVDAAVARLSATTPLGVLAAIVGSVAMHVAMEDLHGSTIGKRVCGLTVILEDGSPATVTAALKRTIGYFWDALFLRITAYHKMSESPRRQRYGDAWGRTQVVRLSSLQPGERRSWLRFAAAVTAGLTIDGAVLFSEMVFRLV